MDKATKETRVADLVEILGSVPSIVLTEYSGLDVGEMTELRRALRGVNVAYKVVKNTLLKRAIEGTPRATLAPFLTGPNGIAFSLEDDPGVAAKACLDFAKKHEKFKVKAGWVDGQAFGSEGLKALSQLPTKDQVRGQLLALLNAPAQKFLALLTAAPRDFLGVLSAREEDLRGDSAA